MRSVIHFRRVGGHKLRKATVYGAHPLHHAILVKLCAVIASAETFREVRKGVALVIYQVNAYKGYKPFRRINADFFRRTSSHGGIIRVSVYRDGEELRFAQWTLSR